MIQTEGSHPVVRRQMQIGQCGVMLLCLAVVAAGDVPPVKQERLPIPSADEQAAANAIIGELYAVELRERSPLKQGALAAKLATDSLSPEHSPAQRFAMLQTAGDLYAQAGDAAGAVSTITAIGQQFVIDPLDSSLALLTRTLPAATTPEKAAALAQECLRFTERAILDDELQAAGQFAGLAESAAVRARQSELRSRAKNRVRDVQTYKSEYEQARATEATLRSNPNDADAKLWLGCFRCFWQDDWSRGLRLIAEGADDKMKQLAREDLAEPSATDALQVGHRWWIAADEETGMARTAMRHRAAYWYTLTLDEQIGLTRSLVEKRLDEVAGELKFVTRPVIPGADVPVRGRFVGMCKGTGAVWVNGRLVAEIEGGTTPVSHSTALRSGDVVVLQVESGFVYRAAKFAFAADDGSYYLPIRRAQLRNVTELEPSAVTAETIAGLEGSPGGGRPEDNYRRSWDTKTPRFDQSEWFFGPGRGTFRFAFVVAAENFVALEPGH